MIMRPWNSAWDNLPLACSPAEALHLLETAEHRLEVRLKFVTVCRASRGDRYAKRLARLVWMSDDAVLAGLAMQLKSVGDWPVTAKKAGSMIQVARSLSPMKNTMEVTKHVEKETFDQKSRWVYKIGFKRQAIARMLHRVARAVVEVHPDQFTYNGGPPSIEPWIKANLADVALVLTTDIPSCFDRVSRKSLDQGSPFSGAVMTSQLYDPMDQAKTYVPAKSDPNKLVPSGDVKAAFKSSGKRGNPQGSALAAIATEIVIKKVLQAVQTACPGTRTSAYSDNLLFGLKSEADRSSVVAALKSSFAEHFGEDGLSELLSRLREGPPQEQFRFCGRRFKFHKGKLRTALSEDAGEKHLANLWARIEKISSVVDYKKAVQSHAGWFQQAGTSALALETYFEGNQMLAAAESYGMHAAIM